MCVFCVCSSFIFFFFKQKTAYEMRISDWSSDVCSSDLMAQALTVGTDDRAAIGSVHQIVAVGDPLRAQDGQRDCDLGVVRSEERRVGKECVSTCRSRWSPYH